MKTLKELEKGCGKKTTFYHGIIKEEKVFWKCGEYMTRKKVYCENCDSKIYQTKRICELIKKDIEYGESQLTGTFQENKPWNWRIDGMKDLIKRIEGSGIYNKDIRKPKQKRGKK